MKIKSVYFFDICGRIFWCNYVADCITYEENAVYEALKEKIKLIYILY